MNKIFLLTAMLFSFQCSIAQFKLPANSPIQTIKQDFGIGSIEIKYSRPGVKGRKIFGGLVPYDALWRTGANGATIIKLSDPLNFNGNTVDSGSYAFYVIPGRENWTVILNKGINNWGTDGYKEAEDVVRFSITPVKIKKPVETFSIQFTDIKPERCNIELSWDKTSISIPVTADIKPTLKSRLEKALSNDSKPPYYQAAQFYSDYLKDDRKALEYSNKAVEANPSAYWIWYYQAKIQQRLGDNAGALKSSQKSADLAEADKNDEYIEMNREFQKKLPR